jgi:hypothetical protein
MNAGNNPSRSTQRIHIVAQEKFKVRCETRKFDDNDTVRRRRKVVGLSSV